MADAFLKRNYRLVSGGTDNHLVLLGFFFKKFIKNNFNLFNFFLKI